MTSHRAFVAGAAPAQEPDRHGDVSQESPYLLTIEAARFLKFDLHGNGTRRTDTEAMRLFREWAARNRVPQSRRGRTLLYSRSVLAAFVEQRDWTKRHKRKSELQLIRKEGNA